jgi:hypothetical protein
LHREGRKDVVGKNRRARPVVERQAAPKVAPQIHGTSRPTVDIDPPREKTVAAAEVEQEPPFPPVRQGAPPPSGMKTASKTNRPEKELPTDLVHELKG